MRVYVALALALTVACSDDGATEASPDAAGAEVTSAVDAATEEDAASDAAGEPDAPAHDADAAAEDAEPPPHGVCPGGPYAGAPLASSPVGVETLAASLPGVYDDGFAEGPVWVGDALYLSYIERGGSDPPRSSILRLTTGGALEVAIPDSGSNGLAVRPDGMIVAATHDDGGVSLFDPATGARESIVNSYEGARLNSPNDLVLHSGGAIYVTDPSWQAPSPAPQPVTGVYRVDPAGDIALVDGSLAMPNGIALSIDEAALYVGHLIGVQRYDVAPDGSVSTPGEGFGSDLVGVDGLTVDCAGNVYVTVHTAGEVRVLSPAGEALGTVQVVPMATNVAFGGPERRTLYITAGNPGAGGAIHTVELAIPGLPY